MTESKREIAEYLAGMYNSGALFLDGFDDAIIGFGGQFTNPKLVVYSYQKIVKALMAQGMDAEGAAEYFSFNIEGAWMGRNTPLIVQEIE